MNKKSKMKVVGQPLSEIQEQQARKLKMQHETEFTHQDDYEYARDLFKIVMEERKKIEDFKNLENRDKESDDAKSPSILSSS